ncbi:c-type cytochrome [Aliiroseovarius sp.]|uniref:c-type cytochrome n=1 Tax=Aliiroseovarius sp. TaxID=1872442 RepID=UPI003BABFC13
MTITKLGGGVLGALLFFLLGNWAAESLYHTGPAGHGHGDEEHAMGYYIATGDDDAAVEEEVEEGPSFEELMAAADPAKGEKVFSKCKACHKLEDGANGTGPHLYGVVDRAVASVDGFGYSDVVAGLGGAWGAAELNAFIENPKGYAPGTKMSFKGISKPADRANLIAFLQTIGG